MLKPALLSEKCDLHLEGLVRTAHGMLPIAVYHRISAIASRVSGSNFVEIGTAHGAASIAIAMGASKKERDFSIWTVDQLGGRFSSRRIFGSVEDNRLIIEENFRRANVAELIYLFVGSSSEFLGSNVCPEKVDFLFLDADGRIDRDLVVFYDRMSPGDPIIIDDVDDRVYLSRDSDGVPFVDLKHRISSLLLEAYVDAGLIRINERLGNTAFCERGVAPFDPKRFSEISVACYRELVFSSVDDPVWHELAAWKEDARSVRLAVRGWRIAPSWFWAGARWVYRSFSLWKRRTRQ